MVLLAMLVGFGIIVCAGFLFATRERAQSQQQSQPIVTHMSSDDFVDFALDVWADMEAAKRRK